MDSLRALENLVRRSRRGTRRTAATARLDARALAEIQPAALLARLDRNPSFGLQLAQLAHDSARHSGNPNLALQFALLYVRALNAVGEFRQAVELGTATAARAQQLHEPVLAAQAQLEVAWAESFRGDLARVRACLKLAAIPHRDDSATPQAERAAHRLRARWIRARVLREQGKFLAALERFQQLHARFVAQGDTLQAARVLIEIGQTRSRIHPPDAIAPLQEARAYFRAARHPTQLALCDYFLAQAHMDLSRFDPARRALGRARRIFRLHHMAFFEAYCELDVGYLLCAEQKFAASLAHSQRAQDTFAAFQASQEQFSCEINIAWALIELNRNAEALPHLQNAAEVSRRSGRITKTAVCLMDMGKIYTRQGQYARALDHLQQARDVYVRSRQTERLADCQVSLGRVYAMLGAYDDALAVLGTARRLLVRTGIETMLGTCELDRARVLIALGRPRAARRALDAARRILENKRQTFSLAYCDRLRAQLDSRDRRAALARLARSERTYAAAGLDVDRALCALTRAELFLSWRDWQAAERELNKAANTLGDGFPDQRWRIEYGLGQVAENRQDPARARDYYLRANRTLANLRADLQVEAFSDAAFGARQYALDGALRFVVRRRLDADALELIETAKGQAFLRQLTVQDWRAPRANRARRRTASARALHLRASALLAELNRARARAARSFMRSHLPPFSPSARVMRRGAADTRLSALEHEYEELANQLRLRQRGMAGTPTLEPFDLAAFREMAAAQWGSAWVALDYYLARGWLYLVYLDPDRVQVFRRHWGHAQRFALDQCAATHRDLRESTYHGTLHGMGVPTDGAYFLSYLAEQLLPAALLESRGERTVILSPHGMLHQLPFHALLDGETPLLERFTFVHTPNLQALTRLVTAGTTPPPRAPWLLYGISEFGDRETPLPETTTEIRQLCQLLGARAVARVGSAATRAQLLDWHRKGELDRFEVLHFATHALVQPGSPHSSHIMLADGDLTVLDILELDLDARLVTLSGCSTAEGKIGYGDEALGLTRAFFYAGARALVASLWAVEDQSTPVLMTQFYRNLRQGASIAQALRAAQLSLRASGYTPFQWAPFVAIGAA